MYIGIDVGGTKTLIAVFTDKGKLVESRKIPTTHNYDHFLLELRNCIIHMEHQDWQAAGVGMPVSRFDRTAEVAQRFGNLPWKNEHVQHDLERILQCPVAIENDAKLGSLSEAMLVKEDYRSVLYITISTGIGYGLTVDGQIDTNIGDGGGRTIMLEHKGNLVPWETFGSGKAIVARYGKRAEAIHDEVTWKAIARDLKLGFLELIAVTQPDVVVVGGSVGNYFERFKKFLSQDLKAHETPSLHIPPLKKATRPEEAVIYGCYELALKEFSHATAD